MARRAALLLATLAAAIAAAAATPSAAPAARPRAQVAVVAPSCARGYYKNAYGRCVRRPTAAPSTPAGATAKCTDGTFSFSQHASGTCSHHGGVAVWIHHP